MRRLLILGAVLISCSGCWSTGGSSGGSSGVPGFTVKFEEQLYYPAIDTTINVPAWDSEVQGRMVNSYAPTYGYDESFEGSTTWYDATYGVPYGKVPADWQLLEYYGLDCDAGYNNWSEATSTYIPATNPLVVSICVVDPSLGMILPSGGVLSPNDSIVSNDGRFTFIYQDDGNLVLYYYSTPIWASHTDGTCAGETDMQGDGNLVVYDCYDTPQWSSGTAGYDGAVLMMRDDGDAVVYTGDATILWDSGTGGH